MIRNEILEATKRASGSDDIKLDTPSGVNHGDYASNVALVLAKRQEKKPRELAEEIVAKLNEDLELKKVISKIEIAGPGFINFWVSDNVLADTIDSVLESRDKYGTNEDNKGKKVVVEYSSPNIAKPFGIGHFRSTIIGDAVANLLQATGWEVIRDSHWGDWGTQFGKQMYAISAWGDIDEIEKSENPVKELVALYVKFHEEAEKDESLEDKAREWFRRLEDGDAEAHALWQKCVDWSLKDFMRVYKILGVAFTENDAKGYGESYFEDKMQVVIDELSEKGLLKEGKEGAKIVEFKDEKYPPLMIVKKDGATLYATRDLAADKFRINKYGDDVVIINEVGAEQSLYFEQLFELERMLSWVKPGQRVHIKHGLFKFGGKKISTRKGNIIVLEDVIDEAIARAKKYGSDDALSLEVAIGALKWNELKRDPIGEINFDWDELLSMEGNSGPYLQYTYARVRSIIEKAADSHSEAKRSEAIESGRSYQSQSSFQDDTHDEGVTEKGTISAAFDDKEKRVARVLIHYPEKVQDAAINYSPHVLANYLFELASEFNSFYNAERILENEREKQRLLLASAVGQTIKNGLNLLGIKAPSKM